MEAALRIEAQYGLSASFWEEGPAIPELLRQCLDEGLTANPYPQVAALLASAPASVRPAEAAARTAPQGAAPGTPLPVHGLAPEEDGQAAEPGLSQGIAPGLSPRELQILQCLAAGMPNKQIASSLHISEPTVKFHLRNINHKLDARNRTHAVFIARERGWVQ
ncbi:MAG: helix-turn-helix transcriptional regulator [Paucibacter sp.]|nr:helix-turn-helix transcriptional regulator [Roseateles sp.]